MNIYGAILSGCAAILSMLEKNSTPKKKDNSIVCFINYFFNNRR